MTIRYGPGIAYWAPVLGDHWEHIGQLTCGICHGTGWDCGYPCPFGWCLEITHRASGLDHHTSAADLRAAADRIEHTAPGWARRCRQEADHLDLGRPAPGPHATDGPHAS